MKLKTKLLLIGVLPLLVAGIVICAIAYGRVNSVITEIVKKDLQSVALMERSAITLQQGNKYVVDAEGNLINNDILNITKDTAAVDDIKQKAGIDVTVFFGDTRYMTTIVHDGERQLGTQAGAKVVSEVVENGRDYFSSNVDVLGENYYAYYVPFYDDDSSKPVGMVFAGMSQEDVQADIMGVLTVIMVVTAVLIIASIGVILYMVTKLTSRLKYGIDTLEEVANGNLAVQIDSKMMLAKDETGDITRSIRDVKEHLERIVSQIVNKSNEVSESANALGAGADETTGVVEQVERAVLEIAEGATTQAGETQEASENVVIMGNMIEETGRNVEVLQSNAGEMAESGRQAQLTLRQLSDINEKVKESVQMIYEQTNTTNESSRKISEAVTFITSIAEETNLLALNASIEAARAGEQGRGFAVVAAQIQTLAEQSNASANQIQEIVNSLMRDAEEAVVTMEAVREVMNEQNLIVDKTGEMFEKVMKGIENSKRDITKISENTKNIDKARDHVVEIVQNLSSIAEQYAASTQETSASASEMSATVQEMSSNALNLQGISQELKETVEVFKL